MLIRLLSPTFAACLILAACGGPESGIDAGHDDVADADSTTGTVPPPTEPTAATFVLTPASPQPGETFTASFDPQNERGGFFSLSLWLGEAWTSPIYLLESDANKPNPSATRITDEIDIEDYGVSGPGPDEFVMPDRIEAGIWRLCTANAVYDVCVQITIGQDALTSTTPAVPVTVPPPDDPDSFAVKWVNETDLEVAFPELETRGSCAPLFEWTGTEWVATSWQGNEGRPGEASLVQFATGCFDDEAEGPGFFDVSAVGKEFGDDTWLRICDREVRWCSQAYKVTDGQ